MSALTLVALVYRPPVQATKVLVVCSEEKSGALPSNNRFITGLQSQDIHATALSWPSVHRARKKRNSQVSRQWRTGGHFVLPQLEMEKAFVR